MGRTLFRRPSILVSSRSAQRTAFPVSARHAPTTRPTYPEPTTVMFTRSVKERRDAGHHLVELLARQLGVDRQGGKFLRPRLALGALTLLVATDSEASAT